VELPYATILPVTKGAQTGRRILRFAASGDTGLQNENADSHRQGGCTRILLRRPPSPEGARCGF
jgi:hypothetical protein